MDTTDFNFEFYTEGFEEDPAIVAETRNRLEALTANHDDITGASVGLDEVTGSETPYLYRARVNVYMRPNDIVAVEKAPSIGQALDGALDAVERQVRQQREKLRERWKQP